MIFVLNAAALADQEWPNYAAQNMQPRQGRMRED
jgi:hypothetical protein